MSDELKKLIGEFTDVTKAASEKADAAAKKGDEVGGEVKELVTKMGDFAEDIQKITLANEEKAKADAARMDELEKIASRVGNGAADAISEDENIVKEYNQNLNSYLRKGQGMEPSEAACQKAYEAFVRLEGNCQDKDSVEMAVKTMQAGVGPDGGYLILPDRRAGIDDIREFETSPMRALAEVVSTASDEYEIVIDDDESASGGWVGETTARPDTETSKVGVIKIALHEQYAQPKVTQKFLDDASINVEQFVANKTNDILTRTENTSFVVGDGSSKPKGFLTYDATAGSAYERGKIEQIASGSAGNVTYDGLIKLQNSLKASYGAGAAFMMQRATWEDVLLLKDSQNRPLLRPDLLLNGAELRLLGKRVVFADDMPAVAADALAIAYGDFGQGYTIVDRMGLRTLRDPYTEKPFIKFYTTKRVGGAVTNYEAIKIQKLEA